MRAAVDEMLMMRPLVSKPRYRELAHEEHGLHVDLENAIEFRFGNGADRRAAADARIVDENIERDSKPARFERRIEGPKERCWAVIGREIGGDREGGAASLRDRGNGLGCRRLIRSVMHGDQRAVGGKLQRNRPADAAAATGDKRDFVRKLAHAPGFQCSISRSSLRPAARSSSAARRRRRNALMLHGIEPI